MNNSQSNQDQLRAPQHRDVVEWISTSWSALRSRVIESGFAPLCRDATEDDQTQKTLDLLVSRLSKMDMVDSALGGVSDDFNDKYFMFQVHTYCATFQTI